MFISRRKNNEKIYTYNDSNCLYCVNSINFSFWNESRWPYYLFENNFKNCLFNHLSGQSPTEGFEDLQNLLSLGYAPQMLVWCHGMNGAGDTIDSDGNPIIDATKKEIIDWLGR